MEALLGSVVAIVMSLGYTEVKMRKHQKEYKALVERVDVMEQNLGRNMLASLVPMSKAVKELQEAVGVR
jgi:hypothetical protein